MNDNDRTLGLAADHPAMVAKVFFPELMEKFEIHGYRSAATILAQNFPVQFSQIVSALEKFQITTRMIRSPGGSKGPIAKYVDNLFPEQDWKETRITADLHVKLLPGKGNEPLQEYV